MTAIEDVLWPGMHKLAPASQLGGVLARKPGYHNSRDRLPASDYSVGQFAVDRQGPADEGSAIDWTFPDAQRGDYRTIALYSNRLLLAGRRGHNGDPRTIYMREFYGQTDNDREVEGWDFTRGRAASSDSSHLWHIHISIHRKYINDKKAMESILSILSGESVNAWIARNARKVETLKITTTLPVLREGDDDRKLPGYDMIVRIQGIVGADRDRVWGPKTTAKIAEFIDLPPAQCKVLTEKVYRRLFGLSA